MSEVVIKIEDLHKKYRLGAIGGGTLTADLQSWWAKVRGKEDPNRKIGQEAYTKNETFMALKGIDLEIYKGDRIGIIGGNGAGKSTMLKILSRVTAPTDGILKIKGRISSMLEVGTGFHGELTGRENIYLNGAILGMNKEEVDSKIEEIIEFSECRQFIDTPVKRYSSGMFVKLAFAVCAHLDSEILIMDEVLAVGDMKFQKKCIDKMKELATNENRTVLYVSHSMNTIRDLCNRVVVLDKGKVIFDGGVEEGIQVYMENIHESGTFLDCRNIERMNHLPKNRKVSIESIEVLDKTDCEFTMSEKMKLKLGYKYNNDIKNLSLRIEVRYADDSSIATAFKTNFDSGRAGDIKVKEFEYDISQLAPGDYKTLFVLYDVDENGIYEDFDAIWPGITFKKLPNDNKIDKHWNHHGWGHVVFKEIKELEPVS